MDNNLNQDLTIDELDKLTEEGKIKEITVTLTSIYDGTRTVMHADKNTIWSISESSNGVVTSHFMSFPTENNITSTQENIASEEDESFEDEISSNDDYEDEINTPFDIDDGEYRDEEERAQEESDWEDTVAQNYWREHQE